MRKKTRIKKILKIIEEKWNEYPDQRLGQLLQNYFGYPRGDIFFVEDDVFGVDVFDKRTKFMTKKQSKQIYKFLKTLKRN